MDEIEQLSSIYPLIVMDYYPLRIDMSKNKNSIFMCRNKEDIEKLLTAYHKEIGENIRNVEINIEKNEITFQRADNYFGDKYIIEDSDWYDKEVHFETLKIFENGNKTT